MKTWAIALLLTVSLPCADNARGDDGGGNSSSALIAKYRALSNQLNNNQFLKPIHLDSRESADSVTGDIYALVNHPFAVVGTALSSPGNWCDILILHFNTKYCRESTTKPGGVLHVSIGKKHYQSLDQAFGMVFSYRVANKTPTYLRVMLDANEGPLSTRNYRIVLEAMPLESGKSLIRLSYSYAYGVLGRLAMQAYLGSSGSNRVGFTTIGKTPDGQAVLIGGMRGLVERNTMRYYLAIEAFLGAWSLPPQARMEKILRDWFAACENYPRQLHELEQDEYLDMKRKEYRRQQQAHLT